MRTLHSICFGLFSNEWNTQKATLPAAWPLRCARQRPCHRAPARLHTAPQQDLPSHLAFRKWAPRAPPAPPLCHLHSGLCHQGGPTGARRSALNVPTVYLHIQPHLTGTSQHLTGSCSRVSWARGPALPQVHPEERGRCSPRWEPGLAPAQRPGTLQHTCRASPSPAPSAWEGRPLRHRQALRPGGSGGFLSFLVLCLPDLWLSLPSACRLRHEEGPGAHQGPWARGGCGEVG